MARIMGVLVIWFLLVVMSLGCIRHSQAYNIVQSHKSASDPPSCLEPLTKKIAAQAIAFYKEMESKNDWGKLGISTGDKTIAIWVVPPVVDFENSIEIVGRKTTDRVRLRLMGLIETSLGAEIAKHKKEAKFRFLDNSEEGINQLFDLIDRKYSSKKFDDNDLREIGKFRKTHLLVKVTIIPGNKKNVAPLLTANLLSVETLIKFNFSGIVEINLDQCGENLKSQFELLIQNTLQQGRNKINSWTEETFKEEIAEFIKTKLYKHRGEPIFLDKFNEKIKFLDMLGYLEYLYSLTRSAILEPGDHEIVPFKELLNSCPVSSLNDLYDEKKNSCRIIISPRIIGVFPHEEGQFVKISLLIFIDGSAVAESVFSIKYVPKYVTICGTIPGDINDEDNLERARHKILREAARRVGEVFFANSQMIGDKLKVITNSLSHVRFDNALFNKRIVDNKLCFDINLERIIDLSFLE